MTVTIEETMIYDIPVYLVRKETTSKQKAIFLFHGMLQNKEELKKYASLLAEQNYYVICVDSMWHGERIDQSLKEATGDTIVFRLFDIIEQNAKDFHSLIHFFKDHPSVDIDSVGISGFSMGAYTSFYIASRYPQIKAIVPFIGLASFVDYWDEYLRRAKDDPTKMNCTEQLFEYDTKAWRSRLSQFDSSELMKEYAPKPLLMINGFYDKIVPLHFNQELYDRLTPYYTDYPERLKLSVHDVGHKVTAEMIYEAVEWFKLNL